MFPVCSVWSFPSVNKFPSYYNLSHFVPVLKYVTLHLVPSQGQRVLLSHLSHDCFDEQTQVSGSQARFTSGEVDVLRFAATQSCAAEACLLSPEPVFIQGVQSPHPKEPSLLQSKRNPGWTASKTLSHCARIHLWPRHERSCPIVGMAPAWARRRTRFVPCTPTECDGPCGSS